MQWTVQVMGPKKLEAQFQRTMEWILKDLPCAEPYLDDIILGSKGNSVEEIISNHTRD